MWVARNNEDNIDNLILKFEILKTMYDNSNITIPFNEYAKRNWHNIDMNYFNTIG